MAARCSRACDNYPDTGRTRAHAWIVLVDAGASRRFEEIDSRVVTSLWCQTLDLWDSRVNFPRQWPLPEVLLAVVSAVVIAVCLVHARLGHAVSVGIREPSAWLLDLEQLVRQDVRDLLYTRSIGVSVVKATCVERMDALSRAIEGRRPDRRDGPGRQPFERALAELASVRSRLGESACDWECVLTTYRTVEAVLARLRAGVRAEIAGGG